MKRKPRDIEGLAPSYSIEISMSQDLQAKVLGISRKAIRAMREHGVISYPMTIEQYETLAPLFRGVGTTELLRMLLAGMGRSRRERLVKTAGMGQMEAFSYAYFVRFRFEHLHEKRFRCSYRVWREYMLIKFPKGAKWLMWKFYEKSKMQAKNAIQYALRKGDEAVESLAAQYGLKKRAHDEVWDYPAAEKTKARRKKSMLNFD